MWMAAVGGGIFWVWFVMELAVFMRLALTLDLEWLQPHLAFRLIVFLYIIIHVA